MLKLDTKIHLIETIEAFLVFFDEIFSNFLISKFTMTIKSNKAVFLTEKHLNPLALSLSFKIFVKKKIYITVIFLLGVSGCVDALGN